MKVLRTPEKCFKGLKNYPYKPNYTTIKTKEGDNLRIHHIDVGPKEGPTIVCFHGQPAWSYLYTKMIPHFLKRKDNLDHVVYSLIRLKDPFKAKELQ